jgi:hypothetical protein
LKYKEMLARKRKKKSRRQLTQWEKNPLNKNQGWERIHQKYKAMRTQVDTTQRKNKSKQSTKKSSKELCKEDS